MTAVTRRLLAIGAVTVLAAASPARAQSPEAAPYRGALDPDPFAEPEALDPRPQGVPPAVEDLREENRRALVATPGEPPATKAGQAGNQRQAPQYFATGQREATRRIERALQSALPSPGLEFVEQPLEQVVALIEEEYGFEVQLDLQELENLGIRPDTPLTVSLRNISLESALDILLSDLGLDYVIEDEVLLVTSEDKALAHLVTAVYPVGDLVGKAEEKQMVRTGRRGGFGGGGGGSGPSVVLVDEFDPLIDAIISTIAAESWAENGGGEAEIRGLRPGMLVVSQTREVHGKIASLLHAIRQARQNPLSRQPGSPKASQSGEAEEVTSEDIAEATGVVEESAEEESTEVVEAESGAE